MSKRTFQGFYILYKHVCTVNGKAYIGFTKLTIDERFYLHLADVRKGSQLLFHNALRKHGIENWQHSIIETQPTKSDAIAAEIRLIAGHQTLAPNGYNMTHGGEGGELGPEALARYYAAIRTPETSRKRSVGAKKAFQRPDVRQRHSEAINQPDAKARQSKALKATNARPEVKQRRSEAQKIAQNDLDVSRRKSASNKASHGTPEARARQSVVTLKMHADKPELKEQLAACRRRPVEQIAASTGRVLAVFGSIKAAEEITGVFHTNISGCVTGRRSQAGGFIWRYALREAPCLALHEAPCSVPPTPIT